MSEFSVRSDHIDVEQIMRQIRARIRDKRGADYTEAEIRELASVKLDRFLDPRAVRSDLLVHFKRQHQPAPLFLEDESWPALYAFDGELVYESSRGLVGRALRLIRRILNPVMKLFINPGPVLHVLHLQGPINAKHKELFERISERLRTRDELDALNFEMFNNLVVEATRLGIEVKNLRMQVESLSTRLDFDERRARALEGVVQYRPGTPLAPAAAPEGEAGEAPGEAAGEGRGARRRRRRRGRRRGGLGPEGAAADRPASEGAADQAEDEEGAASLDEVEDEDREPGGEAAVTADESIDELQSAAERGVTEVSEAPATERTTPVAAPAPQEPDPTSHDVSSAVPPTGTPERPES
jgi:hypothetical protein